MRKKANFSEIDDKKNVGLLKILDVLPFGIIILDPGEVVESYNKKAKEILGKLDGKKSDQLFPNSPQFFQYIRSKIVGMRGRPPLEIVTKSAILLITASLLKGGTCLITLENISERRISKSSLFPDANKLQRHFIEEEEKSKHSLFRYAGHELKTPLNPIKIELHLLKEGKYGNITARQQKAIANVIRNANYLELLINNLLELGRMETESLQLTIKKINSKQFFADIISSFKIVVRDKKIGFISHLQKLPVIDGDENKLRQAFSNILQNAIKFTEKGSITLTVSANKNYLIVEVKDTGKGIPKNKMKKIFKPFEKVEQDTKGLGLGLTIVKGVLDAHGGKISITSTVGEGSVFKILLPRHIRQFNALW
jgi:signal transduction histidine kinase